MYVKDLKCCHFLRVCIKLNLQLFLYLNKDWTLKSNIIIIYRHSWMLWKIIVFKCTFKHVQLLWKHRLINLRTLFDDVPFDGQIEAMIYWVEIKEWEEVSGTHEIINGWGRRGVSVLAYTHIKTPSAIGVQSVTL